MCVNRGLADTSADDTILLEEAISSLRDDDQARNPLPADAAVTARQEEADRGTTGATVGEDGKSGSDDGGEKSKTAAQNSKPKITKKSVQTNDDAGKSKPAKKGSKTSKRKSRKLLASTSVISDDEILSSSASGTEDDDDDESSSDSEDDVIIYCIFINKIYVNIILSNSSLIF